MIVCICANVTDKKIEECSKDGCTLEELKDNLNTGKVCGCCNSEVELLYNTFKDMPK